MKTGKFIRIYEYLRKDDFVLYSINQMSKDLKLNWRTTNKYINILKSLNFQIVSKKEYIERRVIELNNLNLDNELDGLVIRRTIKLLRGLK